MSDATASQRKNAAVAVLWMTLISISSYAAFTLWVGIDDVKVAFAKVTTQTLLICTACSLSNFALRIIRWWSLAPQTAKSIPRARLSQVYLSGLALTASPGKLGELVRSIFLAQNGISFVQSIVMFLQDRLSDLFGVVGVVLLLSLYLDNGSNSTWFCLALALLAFALLVSVRWWRLLRFVARVSASAGAPSARSRSIAAKAATRVHALHENPKLSEFAACWEARWSVRSACAFTALGAAAYSIQSFGLILLSRDMGFDIASAQLVLTYLSSTLLGAASFIPSGLGVMEGSMILQLSKLGVDTPSAAALTLIMRAATLWLGVVIGCVALASLIKRK